MSTAAFRGVCTAKTPPCLSGIKLCFLRRNYRCRRRPRDLIIRRLYRPTFKSEIYQYFTKMSVILFRNTFPEGITYEAEAVYNPIRSIHIDNHYNVMPIVFSTRFFS